MCRVFGCVSAEPVSIHHELLHAENPLIRQSEEHWLARPGQLLVASEQVTDEPGWHSVQQDVLLTLDPDDLEEPHAERLLGDDLVERAEIQKVDLTPHLRGEERGAVAAERARAAAAAG